MWRCVDVDVEMCRCGDVMCRCGVVEMWTWRCGDV